MQTHVVQMGIPHPRARTHVHAHAHPPMESTRTLIHKHVPIRTQMYARSDTRLVGTRVCRSRRARARTYDHAHTLAWNLHVRPYACTRTQTYTYPQADTHLAVAGWCCAASPAGRAHTHTHSCTSARTDAEMHSTSTLRLAYNRAYKCRYFIHIYIYIWI